MNRFGDKHRYAEFKIGSRAIWTYHCKSGFEKIEVKGIVVKVGDPNGANVRIDTKNQKSVLVDIESLTIVD